MESLGKWIDVLENPEKQPIETYGELCHANMFKGMFVEKKRNYEDHLAHMDVCDNCYDKQFTKEALDIIPKLEKIIGFIDDRIAAYREKNPRTETDIECPMKETVH